MITADEAADTLLLLVPGFVALKIFYRFGLKTRRSDLEWALWSLAAAAFINAVLNNLVAEAPALARIAPFALGLGGGVLLGVGLVAAWRLWTLVRPAAKIEASRTAWDAIFDPSKPAWVQVWTTDGKVVSGAWRVVADSVETDDLDLYLTSPAWVEGTKVVEMTGVAGFLIARERIAYVQVLSPVPDQ